MRAEGEALIDTDKRSALIRMLPSSIKAAFIWKLRDFDIDAKLKEFLEEREGFSKFHGLNDRALQTSGDGDVGSECEAGGDE